ncbi:MAG: hypothetical protein E7175_01385 [Erysipelotrichaceae bacterium]|nr:hypothetical protein [Erysipelotrichaceae bacterium]
MKTKTTKGLVLSALAALSFASIAAGTTYALFTSKTETNIEVSSGKINVSANLSGLQVYSAVFDSETEYHEELQSGTREEGGLTQHLFSNGGYAAYDDTHSLFIIDRITPGDLVKFSFAVANDSNVSFKYRFSYVAIDTDENPDTSYLDLIKGMDTSIKVGSAEPVTYRGLAKYQTAWEVKSADASLDNVEYSLSLPVAAGNQYQNKNAKILVSFEAVQANAYTDGDAEIVLVEEDIVSDPVVVVANEDTEIIAESATSNLEFTVTIPQNVKYGDNVPVSPTDVLTIEVTDLGKTEEVYTTETSLNFDLVVKVNGVEANGFSKPLPVQIYVGKGLIIASVKHKTTEITVYDYDTETGYISFSTSSFSPFEVSFLEGVEVDTAAKLIEVLPNGGKIGIKEDITVNQFLPIVADTTIIGLGHTITVDADRAFRVQTNGVELNIGDLHIANAGTKCERAVQIDSNVADVTINLDNVVADHMTYYALNVCSGATNATLNLDNCTFSGYCALQTWANNTTFNASNSRLIGNNKWNYGATNSFATIVTYASAQNATINLTNTYVDTKTINNVQWAYLLHGGGCTINSINCNYSYNEEPKQVNSYQDLDTYGLVQLNSEAAFYETTFNVNGNVWQYEGE